MEISGHSGLLSYSRTKPGACRGRHLWPRQAPPAPWSRPQTGTHTQVPVGEPQAALQPRAQARTSPYLPSLVPVTATPSSHFPGIKPSHPRAFANGAWPAFPPPLAGLFLSTASHESSFHGPLWDTPVTVTTELTNADPQASVLSSVSYRLLFLSRANLFPRVLPTLPPPQFRCWEPGTPHPAISRPRALLPQEPS